MSASKINRMLAAGVFLVSFLVYFDTMAPTVSYWDCGEFIATSYTLGVPHPPGSPLYLIIGRLFSMIPFSDDIAFRVNLISPLVSALAVMFLYFIIVQFVRQIRGSVKSGEDRLVAFGSGLMGSLIFAFTDSHWFNAVEAEVYAVSTLLTALVVWLILRWAERSEETGNERYILIISYVVGLASGIHLLNLLTLPFIGLVIYFKKLQFSWKSFLTMAAIVGATFLIIYLGIIKGFPKLALVWGVGSVGLLTLVLFAATIFSIRSKKRLWSTVLSSLVLIVISYSTYAILFIRSNQDPSIDENDPETVARAVKYLEREQYGSIFFLPRKYKKNEVGSISHKIDKVGSPRDRGRRQFSSSQNLEYMFHDFGRQVQFLWDYQIVRMYNRYFLWQFGGRGPAGQPWVSDLGALAKRQEDGVNWIQFGLPFPFLLGILGMVYHFKKDRHHALSVLTLFFLTGLAIIFYLNQDKFQPRERDYSYVGSFLAFSIWIGIAGAAILDKVITIFNKRRFGKEAGIITLILLLLIPVIVASTNYRSHDRSGNYVAWDYSYNILQTCEPNAIIFTNGDNDTFPLWYLQEVEGIRKDVRVANLSLLNTDWYIKQLKESRPEGERFVTFSEAQIEGRRAIAKNPVTDEPLHLRVSYWKETPVTVPVADDPENEQGKISWKIKPTLGQGIRVQDLMILHIIQAAKWRYPIYFAVTVSPKNRIGLEKFLQMEGLAFRLRSHEVSAVNYERLGANLTSVIDDNDWSTDYQQGYRFRNLNNPDVYYNPNVIKLLQNYRSAFLQLGVNGYQQFRRESKGAAVTDDDLERMRQDALEPLELMMEVMPDSVIPIISEELYLRIGQLYHDLGEVDQGKEIFRGLHDSNRPDLVGYLIRTYDEMEYWEEAVDLLQNWLEKFPEDTGSRGLMEEYILKANQASGS